MPGKPSKADMWAALQALATAPIALELGARKPTARLVVHVDHHIGVASAFALQRCLEKMPHARALATLSAPEMRFGGSQAVGGGWGEEDREELERGNVTPDDFSRWRRERDEERARNVLDAPEDD